MSEPTFEQAETEAQNAVGSRLSALIYDPVLWWAERSGMTERRRQLLTGASGSVLELGAGTGLNLPHYPADIERLVLAEPEPNMAERLRRRAAKLGREVEIVRAPGELLPFEDDSFDTVVSTLVLCTVVDPGRTLAEVRRVLRPGGSLLFLEHVRSEGPRLARWQDRLHGAWKSFADGCNCNRGTLAAIEDAGFDVSGVDHAKWRRMPPIVRPLVSGRAS